MSPEKSLEEMHLQLQDDQKNDFEKELDQAKLSPYWMAPVQVPATLPMKELNLASFGSTERTGISESVENKEQLVSSLNAEAGHVSTNLNKKNEVKSQSVPFKESNFTQSLKNGSGESISELLSGSQVQPQQEVEKPEVLGKGIPDNEESWVAESSSIRQNGDAILGFETPTQSRLKLLQPHLSPRPTLLSTHLESPQVSLLPPHPLRPDGFIKELSLNQKTKAKSLPLSELEDFTATPVPGSANQALSLSGDAPQNDVDAPSVKKGALPTQNGVPNSVANRSFRAFSSVEGLDGGLGQSQFKQVAQPIRNRQPSEDNFNQTVADSLTASSPAQLMRPSSSLSGKDFLNTLSSVKNDSDSIKLSRSINSADLVQGEKVKKFSGVSSQDPTSQNGVVQNPSVLTQPTDPVPVLENKTTIQDSRNISAGVEKNRIHAESMMAIGNGIRSMNQQGGGELRVRLRPEALGELSIRVVSHGNQVGLQIQASSEKAKKIIEENMGSLKEGLSTQNLVLNQVDLSVGGPSIRTDVQDSGNDSNQSFYAGQGEQQGRFQEQRQQGSDREYDFAQRSLLGRSQDRESSGSILARENNYRLSRAGNGRIDLKA